MKRALTLLSFGAVLAFASTQLLAAGNVENGKKRAVDCFGCHGGKEDTVNGHPIFGDPPDPQNPAVRVPW